MVPTLRPRPWLKEPFGNMLTQLLQGALVIQEVRCLRSYICSRHNSVYARWIMLNSRALVKVAEQNPS